MSTPFRKHNILLFHRLVPRTRPYNLKPLFDEVIFHSTVASTAVNSTSKTNHQWFLDNVSYDVIDSPTHFDSASL